MYFWFFCHRLICSVDLISVSCSLSVAGLLKDVSRIHLFFLLCLKKTIALPIILTTGCSKMYPRLKFFCHFLSNSSEFWNQILCLVPVYNHVWQVTMPKDILLSEAMTKLLDYFCNDIVISHVHMQQNVCRTRSTGCLRCRKTHCHSNNIINNLPMTEYLNCPPPAFTFNLLLKFSATSLINFCDSLFHVTCSACKLSSAILFWKLPINC